MKVFLYYLNDILSTLRGEMKMQKKLFFYSGSHNWNRKIEQAHNFSENYEKIPPLLNGLNIQGLLINPQISKLSFYTFSFKWIV